MGKPTKDFDPSSPRLLSSKGVVRLLCALSNSIYASIAQRGGRGGMHEEGRHEARTHQCRESDSQQHGLCCRHVRGYETRRTCMLD